MAGGDDRGSACSPAPGRPRRRQRHARLPRAPDGPPRSERRRGRMPAGRQGRIHIPDIQISYRQGQMWICPEFWEALVHPGQKLKPGARVVFEGTHTIYGEILERRHFGRRIVRLWTARLALDAASMRSATCRCRLHQRADGRRSRSLSDRLRPGARLDCRTDRRAALHRRFSGSAPRGIDIARITFTSATARSSRSASIGWRIIASNRSATRSARPPPTRSAPRCRGPPRHRRRHHDDPDLEAVARAHATSPSPDRTSAKRRSSFILQMTDSRRGHFFR